MKTTVIAVSKEPFSNGETEKAYQYVVGKTCCLMCFEHLASQCHRNVVAAKIKERDGNGLLISNI